MAQIKKTVSVTKNSQTVLITGADLTQRIKKNHIFLIEGELVPYTIAADSTYAADVTTVTLTGMYKGDTNPSAPGVFAVDMTYPDMIPTISQGDVGTAAVFTQAMYRVQDLISSVAPGGFEQYISYWTDVRSWHTDVSGWYANITASYVDMQNWHADAVNWHGDMQQWYEETADASAIVTTAKTAAQAWASQPSGTVDGTSYSAKYYAAQAAQAIATAQSWATSSALVDGASYGAKKYATDASASATAANNWATSLTTFAGSGSLFGARKYANDAASSATAADTSAKAAASSATAADTSAKAAAASVASIGTAVSDSSASAALAQKWATQTTGEVNGSGSGYSAYYWAQKAAASAAQNAGVKTVNGVSPDQNGNIALNGTSMLGYVATKAAAFDTDPAMSIGAAQNQKSVSLPNTGIGYPGGARFRLGYLNEVSGQLADIIDMSTSTALADGQINSLYFNKATMQIMHRQSLAGQTYWSQAKTIAYTDSSISGNAATATKLATARTINGVNFDGSSAITIYDSTKLAVDGTNTMTGALKISASEPAVVLSESDQSGDTGKYRIAVNGGSLRFDRSSDGAGNFASYTSPLTFDNSGVVAIQNVTISTSITVPDQAAGSSNSFAVNSRFVAAAIANLVASSPSTLDTLNELAAALGNDPNFSTTMTTALGNRLRVDATYAYSSSQKLNAKKNLDLDQVSNTADADKPISTAAQTAFNAKADLAGSTFTGRNNNTSADAFIATSPLSGTASGTITVDLAAAGEYAYTLTSAGATFSFSNVPPAGRNQIVILRLTNAGLGVIYWPSGTQGLGDIGTLSTSGTDYLAVMWDGMANAGAGAYVVFVLGKDKK